LLLLVRLRAWRVPVLTLGHRGLPFAHVENAESLLEKVHIRPQAGRSSIKRYGNPVN
jgi:hypothetical protein